MEQDSTKSWGHKESDTTEQLNNNNNKDSAIQLDGHEFEQALGVGEEQGSLVCCSPWGCKESDRNEGLN